MNTVLSETPTAAEVRARLAFDVERLRQAGLRLQVIDKNLNELKEQLEDRAVGLADSARDSTQPEIGGDGTVQLRFAQAQATAQLAKKARLGELLARSGRLSLVASMAVNHWLNSLLSITANPSSTRVIKGHIDAGRVAHRMLVTLRRKDKLRSGCGQLASAVVVAELVPDEYVDFVEDELIEGLTRGRNARGLNSNEEVVAAASRALRAAAQLLELMAGRAEPAAAALRNEAGTVEDDIAAQFSAS